MLVQFGTYTCINWLRTLPYVRAWAQKYKQRVVVIGVHTPEFAFEKTLENVRRAVQQMKIDYPDRRRQRLCDLARLQQPILARAVLRSMPAATSVSITSARESTSNRKEPSSSCWRRRAPGANDRGLVSVAAADFELAADWRSLRSQEIYLGHDRTQNFSSPGGAALGRRRVYAAATPLELNRWALAGEWTMANQATVLNTAGGRTCAAFTRATFTW